MICTFINQSNVHYQNQSNLFNKWIPYRTQNVTQNIPLAIAIFVLIKSELHLYKKIFTIIISLVEFDIVCSTQFFTSSSIGPELYEILQVICFLLEVGNFVTYSLCLTDFRFVRL